MTQAPYRQLASKQPIEPLIREEAFRIFFPLGMSLGVAGIVVWPLFELRVLHFYPLAAHLRLMTYGFLACFVIGFLLTAGPRLLSCPKPTRSVPYGLFMLSIATAIASLFAPAWADLIFFAQCLFLLLLAAYGFATREDLPPPGFILGFCGLLSAAGGSLLFYLHAVGTAGPLSYAAARILLFQAFPALPLIGVGAFFFPKLTGGPNTQNFPERRTPSRAWLRGAAIAAATALLFIGSIPLEISGQSALAYLMRAIAVSGYLLWETPLLKKSKQTVSQKTHLLICCLSLPASFALIAVFPGYRTALLHLLFILGVSGAILLVSTRVILGHSGNGQLARKCVPALLLGVLLLSGAAALRLLADLAPSWRSSELIAAALLWLLVAGAWLYKIAPKVCEPDPEDAECSQ